MGPPDPVSQHGAVKTAKERTVPLRRGMKLHPVGLAFEFRRPSMVTRLRMSLVAIALLAGMVVALAVLGLLYLDRHPTVLAGLNLLPNEALSAQK